MDPDVEKLHELAALFLEGALIPGGRFRHNDHVQVTSGIKAGASGSVVALAAITPQIAFTVELESGTDLHVAQDQLVPWSGESECGNQAP